MRSWAFYFSAAPNELVGDGEIRFDAAAPYGAVTRLYVDNLDRDGQYIRPMILAYGPGTTIYLEGAGGTYARLELLQPPIERIGRLELAIVVREATATGLAVGPVTAAFFRTPRAAAPRAAADDPLLVTLATAKQHLYITDTAHDSDITQKLRSASGTIRDYLKDRNDPAWDDTTAPPWVVAAVLLLLGHFYENRGDKQETDDQVWNSIANLLRRARDPTIA